MMDNIDNMAEQSLYEMMVIDTDEKARNLRKAFELAEKRGPLVFDDDSDIFEELKRTDEYLERHHLDEWNVSSAEDDE